MLPGPPARRLEDPRNEGLRGWGATRGRASLQHTAQASAGVRQVSASSGHSITRSARNMIESGIVTPMAFAIFRSTTSSNFDGC